MKKIILPLIIVSISLASVYFFTKKSDVGFKEGALKSDLFKGEVKPTKRIQTLFKDHEYRNAMTLLGKGLKKYELDAKTLQEKSKKVSREVFLKGLPQEVRRAYRALYKASDRMKNGQNPSFTQKAPRWIKERDRELEKVELAPELHEFVEKKKTWRSISDEDIQYVIDQCQEERPCIEKSLKIWTDAGQHLSSGQYALIRKVLL